MAEEVVRIYKVTSIQNMVFDLSKFKNTRISHLSPFDSNLAFRSEEHEDWNESSLDCPETLEEFEQTVLELFSPTRSKNIRLN